MPDVKQQQEDKQIQSQRVQRRTYRMLSGVGVTPQYPLSDNGTSPVIVASGVGAKLNTYGDAPAGTNFANYGGPVIANVDVQLVFWGREWQTSPPVAPDDIQNRVNSILNGPYMSKLTQYGCAAKGRIRGTTFLTDQDPPNPFNDGSVQNLVTSLIDNETLPEPDEDWDLFVCVFMPTYANYGPGGASGAHSAVVWNDYDLFDVDNDKVRLAWIGNPGGSGAVDTITTTFSHELAEACTDPETTANPAWRQTPCSIATQCEIGDVCFSSAKINGVQVQAYWSQADGSCVIPVLDPGDWSGVYDNWRTIGGFFPNSAPVTAVSRNPGQFDIFVCGNDGRVYTSWWSQGQDWSGVNDNWRSIGGFFPPGAAIAAVARTSNNLDLFICGNDGRVYTSWWYQGADWSGVSDNWRSIGGFFPAGAPLGAVARTPDNLDLFICGNDGRVYTSWWTGL